MKKFLVNIWLLSIWFWLAGCSVASLTKPHIAQQLDARPNDIIIYYQHHTTFIQQRFPADGQYRYFLLEKGQKIIPVEHWLPQASKGDLVIFYRKPVMKYLSTNQISILFYIQTRPCVACAARGSYQLFMLFNNKGRLIKHEVNHLST